MTWILGSPALFSVYVRHCRKGGPIMSGFRATRDDISVDGLGRMLRDGQITRRGFRLRAAGVLESLAAAEGVLAFNFKFQRA